MKRILLTTTSLVLAAGVASAETSISWSGGATAGVARAGKIDTTATTLTANDLKSLRLDLVSADAISAVSGASVTTGTDMGLTIESAGATTAATLAAQIVLGTNVLNLATGNAVAGTSTIADNAANVALLTKIQAILDATAAGTAVATGNFQSYSEVNATVTGSVSTDNGLTITASMSVDAGEGYDFADDDSFDTTGTSLRGGLDNITIATAMGSFKIDQNAVTHLVDGDDDGAADLLYTNTFGKMSVSAAIDMNKDTDETAVTGGIVRAAADGTTGDVTLVTAVAADVAWSAKVSMPVAGGTAYVAMDEEGGNIFGASTILGGVGLSFSSKLEALEEETKVDRENTLGLTYALGATTLGASWNSKEDGDQWGISAAYAADGLSISASTDEGSDWSVSGSMTLGGGASAVAGVNYTEDAYLGLSFAF